MRSGTRTWPGTGAKVAAVLGAVLLGGAAPATGEPVGAHPAGSYDESSRAREARLPDTYVVSAEPGILPEGIHIRPDGTMYVSSSGTGTLYRGQVSEPRLEPFADLAGTRSSSLGVHTDAGGRVYSVAGDTLTMHDRWGNLVATRTVPGGPLADAYLNDLVVTADAVYVTDWHNPFIYRAERHGNHLGELTKWVDLRPAWPGFPAQYWLLNGIVASEDGKTLLVASNGTEAIWRIDVATGDIERVDLANTTYGPDGMVLRHGVLYSVVNYGLPTGVYIADLSRDLRTGTVIHKITDPALDLPTTLAVHDCRIYVVNSQLDADPGRPPYTVSAMHDPMCP